MSNSKNPKPKGRPSGQCEIVVPLDGEKGAEESISLLSSILGNQLLWAEYRPFPTPNVTAFAKCSERQVHTIGKRFRSEKLAAPLWRVMQDQKVTTNDAAGHWFPERIALIASVDGSPMMLFPCETKKEIVGELNAVFGTGFRNIKDAEEFILNPGKGCTARLLDISLFS